MNDTMRYLKRLYVPQRRSNFMHCANHEKHRIIPADSRLNAESLTIADDCRLKNARSFHSDKSGKFRVKRGMESCGNQRRPWRISVSPRFTSDPCICLRTWLSAENERTWLLLADQECLRKRKAAMVCDTASTVSP